MSRMFRSAGWNWMAWMFIGCLLWVAFWWCILKEFAELRAPDTWALLATEAVISVVWLIATRKERALNRGWARRRREDDRRRREERRKDEERFGQKMAAKEALRELVLKLTGSEEFAGRMAEEHWRGGVVHVFFLNPAGELRELSAARFLEQPFHPQDRPRVCMVRVGSFRLSASTDAVHWYYDYFLRWDEVPLWRIIKWGDDIIVQDVAGEQTSIFVEDVAVNDEVRAYHVLKFVHTYNSVADRVLRTIAEYGVAALRATRQAGQRSIDLQRLRIALQLGSSIFEPGKPLDWEGLVGRDPNR